MVWTVRTWTIGFLWGNSPTKKISEIFVSKKKRGKYTLNLPVFSWFYGFAKEKQTVQKINSNYQWTHPTKKTWRDGGFSPLIPQKGCLVKGSEKKKKNIMISHEILDWKSIDMSIFFTRNVAEFILKWWILMGNSVDGWIRQTHQLSLVVYLYHVLQGFIHPFVGCLEFLSHQQYHNISLLST